MASFSKKLCRAVEKRKLLYDRTIQHRVKRSHIDNAWEAVAIECNESVNSVKTRWRNIRKVLLRFVSKANTAQTRKTRSKDYYLYDELQFLLPHLVNVNPDDLADSDMEFGVNTNFNNSQKEGTPDSIKDPMDDSNDCLSTLSASENSSISGVAGSVSVAEKRKRDSKTGPATPTKTLNAVGTKTSVKSEDKSSSSKPMDNYVISESTPDGSSSMRFRRVNTKAQQQPQKASEEKDHDTPQPKSEERKLSTDSQLRTRSKSLYMERPLYEGSTDSDDDYNPPPLKKAAAAIKDSTPVSTSTIVTRKKAAKIAKPLENNTRIIPTAENTSTSEIVIEKPKANLKNEPSEPVTLTNDVDDNDFEGIDMTLLAAAAEAEAAAAADDLKDTNVPKSADPPIGKDAGIQCDFTVDEEDDEFLQRVRKWLQVMTQRQKILFRRGIYQAYIDVYDDPREFEPQKGSDKFTPLSSGMPAIFSGMTPVELRLVRHLAMAVTGHKITASSSPFANFENKAQLASMRAIATNISSSDANTKLPTLPPNSSTSGIRTPPEKPSGNAGSSSGSGSGIVRTTAITLTNHNGRSGSCMPRILRKVVRVGNNNSNGAGASNASNVNHSTNTLLQRNPGLLRHRLVSGHANSSSSSDKQRVYRILPNGVVARQSPGPGSGSATSPNNANSPTSFSQSFAMLCNSNNSPQTPANKNAAQYRQILPKLSTTAAPSGSTAITTVTANGEQKLSGISIRRHVAAGSGPDSGRMQMARRYSVCGSAANDLYTSSNKDEGLPTARRSVAATMQAQQMVNAADPSKITTRVRYAQNPSASIRTGTLSQKFAVPSPVSLNQSGQSIKSPSNIMTGPLAGVPLNEPIPVAMTTWHTAQNSSQEEQEQQMKLMQEMSLTSDNADPIEDPIANEEQPNDTDENIVLNAASKQNCIIASDTFESFVIKNEPLDLEEED